MTCWWQDSEEEFSQGGRFLWINWEICESWIAFRGFPSNKDRTEKERRQTSRHTPPEAYIQSPFLPVLHVHWSISFAKRLHRIHPAPSGAQSTWSYTVSYSTHAFAKHWLRHQHVDTGTRVHVQYCPCAVFVATTAMLRSRLCLGGRCPCSQTWRRAKRKPIRSILVLRSREFLDTVQHRTCNAIPTP